MAFRAEQGDFEDFEDKQDQIDYDLAAVFKEFEAIDLILDCRLCTGISVSETARQIANFAKKFCDACALCLKTCTHEAIAIIEGKARIDPAKCSGCGRCIAICERQAISIQWNESSRMVM